VVDTMTESTKGQRFVIGILWSMCVWELVTFGEE